MHFGYQKVTISYNKRTSWRHYGISATMLSQIRCCSLRTSHFSISSLAYFLFTWHIQVAHKFASNIRYLIICRSWLIILGVVSISRWCLTSVGIPMLKLRRSWDRLIFNMGITIPGKDGLYIETGPRLQTIIKPTDNCGNTFRRN